MKKIILFLFLISSTCLAGIQVTPPTVTTTTLAAPGNDKEILLNDGGSFGSDVNFVFDKAGGKLGVGNSSPSSSLHIKAGTPGTVGSSAAGQLIIQNPTNDNNASAVITGYESTAGGDPDQQLWYFGSSSSSNSNITILNRQSGSLTLGTNGTTRVVIGSAGKVENINFTKLGSDAPAIKMKKLTGTGGTVEGWNTDVAHGLGDISKIISAYVLLTAPNGNIIPPQFTTVAEFQYDFFIDPNNIKVRASAINSGSILASSAFVILLTLEE